MTRLGVSWSILLHWGLWSDWHKEFLFDRCCVMCAQSRGDWIESHRNSTQTYNPQILVCMRVFLEGVEWETDKMEGMQITSIPLLCITNSTSLSLTAQSKVPWTLCSVRSTVVLFSPISHLIIFTPPSCSQESWNTSVLTFRTLCLPWAQYDACKDYGAYCRWMSAC